MANKRLPQLTEATVLDDLDLLYSTGPVSTDAKVTLKDIRNLTHPVEAIVGKTISYTVTAADCDGGWFSNKNSWTSINFDLPPVADNLSIGFIVEENQQLIITPQSIDKISFIKTADGDDIRSNTIGNSVLLRSTKYDWYVVYLGGSWT
jgi:hypothetical protein